MKEKSLLICIAIMSVLLISACSDDGNSFNRDDLVGYWVYTATPHPGTPVYNFMADGSYSMYSNYAMIGIEESGTWNADGSSFSLSNNFGELQMPMTPDNTNHFSTPIRHFYRVGTIPFASNAASATNIVVNAPPTVFNQPTLGSSAWYYFNAIASSNYMVVVNDTDGTGQYNGDVTTTVVGSDLQTLYTTRFDGSSQPITVNATSNEKIYIITDMANNSVTNNYGIQVVTTP